MCIIRQDNLHVSSGTEGPRTSADNVARRKYLITRFPLWSYFNQMGNYNTLERVSSAPAGLRGARCDAFPVAGADEIPNDRPARIVTTSRNSNTCLDITHCANYWPPETGSMPNANYDDEFSGFNWQRSGFFGRKSLRLRKSQNNQRARDSVIFTTQNPPHFWVAREKCGKVQRRCWCRGS